MKSVYPGSIKVGDLVYDEATDKFQRVVATGGEQGSGPRPERAWVAYEGNPRIAELNLNEHYIVKRVGDTKEPTEPNEPEQKFLVVCQAWEESERGWGVRPDGYSVHLSVADHREWIKHHIASLAKTPPDEYSRPSGDPFMLDVTSEIHDELLEAKKTDKNCGISVLQCHAGRLKIPRR